MRRQRQLPLPGVSSVASPEGAAATLLGSHDPALPWLLLATHVAIGLLAALWLRRGEAALAGVVRAVAGFAFRPLLIAVAVAGTVRRTVRRFPRPAVRPHASRTRLFAHSVGRRGPPRSALLPA